MIASLGTPFPKPQFVVPFQFLRVMFPLVPTLCVGTVFQTLCVVALISGL
jgi:hypothetical protein